MLAHTAERVVTRAAETAIPVEEAASAGTFAAWKERGPEPGKTFKHEHQRGASHALFSRHLRARLLC
jgi:hypothetical protein